jgi:hypothetical protein
MEKPTRYPGLKGGFSGVARGPRVSGGHGEGRDLRVQVGAWWRQWRWLRELEGKGRRQGRKGTNQVTPFLAYIEGNTAACPPQNKWAKRCESPAAPLTMHGNPGTHSSIFYANHAHGRIKFGW